MNRRNFLTGFGLGLFTILPGGGRVWRAERTVELPDFVCYTDSLVAPYWYTNGVVRIGSWKRLNAQLSAAGIVDCATMRAAFYGTPA